MKKIISSLVALILLLAVPVNCLAATGFVESITYKPAPDIVFTEDEDGKKVIGHIRDEEGNIVSTEYEDCIVITPISQAATTTKIPEETKNSLIKEYENLKDPSTKLSDVCDGLDEKIKKETNGKYGANNMVVRDMFNITAICGNIKEHLPKKGYTLDLTFNLGIGKNEYITAMVFSNGKWTPVKKVINNGDGTVTVFLETLGHVAFLVPSDAPINVPQTGDTSVQNDIFLWVGIMVISVSMLIILAIITRRKKSDER